jgi:tetratricopeptide (TPR) repeat protein
MPAVGGGEDMVRYSLLAVAVLLAPAGWAQDRDVSDTNPTMVIGPRNPDLHEGAKLLLAGRTREGIERTLRGMQAAKGNREEEAALSNLCSGYVVLERFEEALKYCELLLARNDESWRAYNNRALIYIKTGQYEKANRDLVRAEELSPGAPTLKIARGIYLDTVHPVEPQIEIDDRQSTNRGDRRQQ